MHQLKRDWQFRWNHALELQRVYGAKRKWQIEASPAERNHPVDLNHTRKNRRATKMPVKIEQVTRRN
jgi:hypothetical protein